MKYIVKNCPMYFHNNCYGSTGTAICSEGTSCLIKQVIEECKNECNPTNDEWCRDRENVAQEILQLFKIKECE